MTITNAQQRALDTIESLGISTFHDPHFLIAVNTLEKIAGAAPGDFDAHQDLCNLDAGQLFTVDEQMLVNGPLAISYLAYGANGIGITALRWALLSVTAEALGN